jgi:hypothetical protein
LAVTVSREKPRRRATMGGAGWEASRASVVVGLPATSQPYPATSHLAVGSIPDFGAQKRGRGQPSALPIHLPFRPARVAFSDKHHRSREDNNDQVDCCCWLCRSPRNFGASNNAGPAYSAGRHIHASSLRVRGPGRTRVAGVCVARTTIRHTRRAYRRAYRRGY